MGFRGSIHSRTRATGRAARRKGILEALGLARKVGNPELNSDTVSELGKAYTDQAADDLSQFSFLTTQTGC